MTNQCWTDEKCVEKAASFIWICSPWQVDTSDANQNAVSTYFTSKQILHFSFTEQICSQIGIPCLEISNLQAVAKANYRICVARGPGSVASLTRAHGFVIHSGIQVSNRQNVSSPSTPK